MRQISEEYIRIANTSRGISKSVLDLIITNNLLVVRTPLPIFGLEQRVSVIVFPLLSIHLYGSCIWIRFIYRNRINTAFIWFLLTLEQFDILTLEVPQWKLFYCCQAIKLLVTWNIQRELSLVSVMVFHL